MASNKYYIGSVGAGGFRVNGLADMVEPLKDGDFNNLRRAMAATAQLAVMFANDNCPDDGDGVVRLAVVRVGDNGWDRCVAIAEGRWGKKRARWV